MPALPPRLAALPIAIIIYQTVNAIFASARWNCAKALGEWLHDALAAKRIDEK